MLKKRTDIEKLESKIVKAFKLGKNRVLDLERVYVSLGLSVKYNSFEDSSRHKRYTFKNNTIYININHPENLTFKDKNFFLGELLFAYVVKNMGVYNDLNKSDFKDKIRELTLKIMIPDKKIKQYQKYSGIENFLSDAFIVPTFAIKEKLILLEKERLMHNQSSLLKLFS